MADKASPLDVNAAANASSGWLVGVKTRMLHSGLAWGGRDPSAKRLPERNAGIIPARTSDDLPLPEAPTTARNLSSRMRPTSFAVKTSRPKKREASSSLKNRNP